MRKRKKPIAEYVLEMYHPGSTDSLWMHFGSSQPFMPIKAGDLVNPGVWKGTQSPMKILRACNVEHAIGETREGTLRQLVMVYTEEADGTDPATRLERRA